MVEPTALQDRLSSSATKGRWLLNLEVRDRISFQNKEEANSLNAIEIFSSGILSWKATPASTGTPHIALWELGLEE
jgi:hypothetical protein